MHKRNILLILLWLCNTCLYLARTNITVAIIYMFPKSETIEGNVLSAFYIGYTVSQIPGGWLAAKYGAKRVLAVAVTLWSLSTLFTGFVGKSVPVLICLRAAVGVAEGCNYPSQIAMLSQWIPHSERSRAWSFVVTGEAVGTIVALVGGPFVAHSYGWETIFWVSGACSIFWLVFFLLLTSSSPSTHANISVQELAFIEKTRPPLSRVRSTPWFEILTNTRLLAIVATHCCYNFGYYVCLSWIQKFFSICYGADYSNLGTLSVLPYITIFGCLMIAGNLADRVEIYLKWSPTTVRKVFNTIGMGGAGFFFFLLSLHAPTHIEPVNPINGTTPSSSSIAKVADLKGATIAAVLLASALGVGGFAGGGGYWPALGDLSVEYSSIVVGISNSVASVPGIVGGQVVGNLLSSSGNNWALVFQLAAVIEIVGAAIFLCAGSAEDQLFGKRGQWQDSHEPLVNEILNE